ncbi:MAG TPA: MerR family transcriptional regulator [Chloroflexota bacterium]|nr:MerR family transcriptional regulator [Chloroflexota bacterium]
MSESAPNPAHRAARLRAVPSQVELAGLNRVALWNRVRLTRADVAALTGATVRQLSYWSSKGIVQQGEDQRYDSRAIERVVLIKQGLDADLLLRDATRLADRYQAAEPMADDVGHSAVAQSEIVDLLRRARTDVQLALDYLASRATGSVTTTRPGSSAPGAQSDSR